MKYLITFTFLVLCLSANAQKDASFLIGRWKVVDAILPKSATAEQKQNLHVYKPYLLKSAFKFDANGYGHYKVPLNGINVEEAGMPSSDISWNYNAAKKYVIISERSGAKSPLLQFSVKVENGNTYFVIQGGGMTLKVVKY